MATIARQVTLVAVASMLSALAVSFALTLLTPLPSPRHMTIGEVARTLTGNATGAPLSIATSVAQAPPPGPGSDVVAASVARALGVDPSRVRVIWADDRRRPSIAGGESLVSIAGRDAVVQATRSGFELQWGDRATVAPSTPLPAFRTAVLQADGRWLIAYPTQPVLSAWRLQMLVAFLVSACLVGPMAWLISRRITRPMRALADAAQRAQLDVAPAAPEQGPAEVRAAAVALNAMRERLAADAKDRTRILAAVAHDLRNPLTGLRLRAEGAEEPTRSRMISDIGRMESMINQVLHYVRGAELEEPCATIDAAEWLRLCAEDAAERDEPVTIVEPLPSTRVAVAPEGLRRALANLIDNAVRYGGRARVGLAVAPAMAILRVDDDGPGIPEREIDRLMEPFQRLEQSRSRETGGAGLGLAIASDFARRHGGRLVLRNRAGGGLTAELHLPADQDG